MIKFRIKTIRKVIYLTFNDFTMKMTDSPKFDSMTLHQSPLIYSSFINMSKHGLYLIIDFRGILSSACIIFRYYDEAVE